MKIYSGKYSVLESGMIIPDSGDWMYKQDRRGKLLECYYSSNYNRYGILIWKKWKLIFIIRGINVYKY